MKIINYISSIKKTKTQSFISNTVLLQLTMSNIEQIILSIMHKYILISEFNHTAKINNTKKILKIKNIQKQEKIQTKQKIKITLWHGYIFYMGFLFIYTNDYSDAYKDF